MVDEHKWNIPPAPQEDMRRQVSERYAPLFESVPIGPKVAPNRFYTVPYSTGWAMHQIRFEIAHRATRAEGGWGVVTTGECHVSPEGTTAILDGLELFDDDDMRTLAPIADAIHERGALAGIELVHTGALASPSWWRLPPQGPSQMQSDALFFSSSIAQSMSRADIRRAQDQFVAGATRGRGAGFDIVYLHCAHGFLPVQFLTPYYNQREDEYGGSLENRARFLLETLESMRDAISADTALACRFAIEGRGLTSIEIEEALEVMRMADHLVDLWDIAIGGLANADVDLTPARLYPEGESLQWSRRAKEATAKPVVGCGRFTDVDLMLSVVKSGDLDFVGAARPGIADPFLPRKIATGEFKRIRECVGSNRCAYSQVSGIMSCSQNATMGEEYRRGWNPERFEPASNAEEPVLIVGAGPAGMECATVLARRGFENVHLVDASDKPGGHLRWFTKLPGFASWGHVTDYRKAMIDEAQQIQFVPGLRMNVDDVLNYGGSIVIAATGARWATEGRSFFDNQVIAGADASQPHVITPEQLILGGKLPPGSRVVVYDCEADVTALGVAQYLQAAGYEVELASPFADIGMRAHQDGVSFAIRGEIIANGGKLRPGLVLTSVDSSRALFANEGMEEVAVECDSLVMLTTRQSVDPPFQELASDQPRLDAAGIRGLFRIGDCVAPQNLSDALFSGHRLAREIDSGEPAIPLAIPRD